MVPVQGVGGLRCLDATSAAPARRRRRLRRWEALFLASWLPLAASVVAAGSGANAPREYLDEETGATVFFVGRPLIFGRERATFYSRVARVWPIAPQDDVAPHDLAPAPRDYVSLAAAAVDRSGKYSYVLIGYSWIVGAPQPNESVCSDPAHLVLQLGDRRIELARFDGSLRDAGISQPIHRPWIRAKPAVYTIDIATLAQIAESAHPVLYCGVETPPLRYELWEDQLPALRELVRHLSD